MAGFSKALHQAIAAYINGVQMPTPPASLVVALSAGDPKDDASTLVEPTGGYSRQAVTFTAIPGPNGGTKLVSNEAVVFGPVTGSDWPTVNYGAVFDQSGRMICHGPLGISRRAPVGDTVSFGIGVLQFTIK